MACYNVDKDLEEPICFHLTKGKAIHKRGITSQIMHLTHKTKSKTHEETFDAMIYTTTQLQTFESHTVYLKPSTPNKHN
jgi:hypothetical protein